MSQTEKLIKNYVPMTEASFLVLLCLLSEENHGYGIMQRASELTNGRVVLGAGTVYTILNKMESDGLLEVTRELERRKVYCITPDGFAVLQEERRRLRQMVEVSDFVMDRAVSPAAL